MKYGIVINPIAGKLNIDEKRHILKQVSGILGDCITAGLDTKSRAEFCDCARDLAKKVDILISAGGEGTLSDIINSIDSKAISFLPLGSGNALRYALNLPKAAAKIAEQIKQGKEHFLDLILCDGQKKALFASIGFDGYVLNERERYLQQGITGFISYIIPTTKSLFHTKRADARVIIDEEIIAIPKALSLIITKIPYYGYGLKAAPKARLDDGHLHFLALNSPLEITYALATAALGRNMAGSYRTGKNIQIMTNKKLFLQLNGTLEQEKTDFKFKILPKALTLWY